MTAKEQILSLVGAHKSGLAYSQLMMNEEMRGTCLLAHGKFPMVHYWEGLSDEAAQAILELTSEGILRHEPTDTLAYLAQGQTLDLPVFTIDQVATAKDLGQPHWMPVLLIKAA